MLKLVVLSVLLATAYTKPTREIEQIQNESARYEFSQDIDDHISDLTHQRSEKREGTSVEGMYAYSDGFHKRIVHYIADKNGYRVVGTEVIPLSDGPKIDLGGTASVAKAAHGASVRYVVKGVPGGDIH
ncbi:cuticle protein 6 [Aethina tumida]|uniref:cuticle protein 6 n=1 Tax=Aethina tumida TaxID=116153 RepID=UPI00096B2DCA|nr:cuticle protein 6 [Aethina tumida]